jgi:hypothetical protein
MPEIIYVAPGIHESILKSIIRILMEYYKTPDVPVEVFTVAFNQQPESPGRIGLQKIFYFPVASGTVQRICFYG